MSTRAPSSRSSSPIRDALVLVGAAMLFALVVALLLVSVLPEIDLLARHYAVL